MAPLPPAPRPDAGLGAGRRRHRAAVGRRREAAPSNCRKSTTPKSCAKRAAGQSASWETIVSHCISGGATALDESAIAELLGIAADPDKVIELMAAVESRTEGGVAAKAASVMRMIRGVVSTVSKKDAERVEPMLRHMATAVGELSPDLLVGLLSDDANSPDETRVMDAIVNRMTDRTIAHFVSKNVIASNGTPTDRLVEAFQTLVRNPDDRHRLLNLAHDDAAASPFGQAEGFETVWNHVAEKLLTSYSDATFVSEEYARELSGARTRAVDVEQASDDPPERLAVWVDSVAASALRALDLHLLLDLLRLEQDDARWGALMAPVVHNLEDLLLVGDFDSAIELIGGDHGRGRRRVVQGAAAARDDRHRHAGGRVDDAPRRDAPPVHRRSVVRARQGHVRLARRGAGAPARRGAVGRRARADARAADGDPDRVRRRGPADHRAAEDLAERGRPADGHPPACASSAARTRCRT